MTEVLVDNDTALEYWAAQNGNAECSPEELIENLEVRAEEIWNALPQLTGSKSQFIRDYVEYKLDQL